MCAAINGIKKLAAALIATELKNILPEVKHVVDVAAATATEHHNIYLHSIEAIKLRRQHQFRTDKSHSIHMPTSAIYPYLP